MSDCDVTPEYFIHQIRDKRKTGLENKNYGSWVGFSIDKRNSRIATGSIC
jgi:hypothetical protein